MANYGYINPGPAGLSYAPDRRAAVLASRVFDSCSTKECVEDLQLLFSEGDQAVIDAAGSVRGISCRVTDVAFDTAAFVAARNCYTVDCTYSLAVVLEAVPSAGGAPAAVTGHCCFSRRCVLNGGENGASTFTSTGAHAPSTPEATAQVAEPVLLGASLASVSEFNAQNTSTCNPGTGLVRPTVGENTVYCAVGIFSIVSLLRTVQMTVPYSEYALPARACPPVSGDPCTVFGGMRFPAQQFYPAKSPYGCCGY